MIFGTEWKLERIINNETPLVGTVRVKSLSKRCAIWSESIKSITMSGEEVRGAQKYRLECHGSILKVFFEIGENKGQLFQQFDLKYPKPSAHKCRADEYVSVLNIINKHAIEVTHDVQGPRKNYIMKTVYQKLH